MPVTIRSAFRRVSGVISFVIVLFGHSVRAQNVIPLYDGAIPNSLPGPDKENRVTRPDSLVFIDQISHPTLEIFLPPKDKSTGTAVVICPGGGYHGVAYKHEGTDVARRLNESGIAAFVLKYRIPDDSTMVNKEIGPIQDAQRALQLVRFRAAEWGIKKDRVGIMGFSAGGHLASSAGTHFDSAFIDNPGKISLRPDFMILGYPVITFEGAKAHRGSADNLIGKTPSPEKIKFWSGEQQVSDSTPPSFLVHAKDDDVVPVANSVDFAAALKAHHVSREVYLYAKGGHGFGLVNKTSQVKWIDLCLAWMKERHLM